MNQLMITMSLLGLLLGALVSSQAPADTEADSATKILKTQARAWLKENTDYITCDEQHFIYGVAYIDGSYMERIFYVEGGDERPALNVRFRDVDPAVVLSDADIEPLSFVLEMTSPKVRYALPDGESWRLGEEGWEAALRFKYTTWFGLISRTDGEWQIEWQGYRRPMLPASLKGQSEQICNLFEAD